MLVMAEVGSAFTMEGGPYEWVKMAFGRLHGGIAAILYWVTNPLWVGGSLAFIATDAWSANIFKIGDGTLGDYVFKLVFIWLSIIVAIISLRYGKWIPNAGAFMRVFVLGFFSFTLIVYAVRARRAGFPVSTTLADALGLPGARAGAALQLRRLRAAERGRRGDGEPREGRADLGACAAASSACCMYVIPILGILLVLPAKAISTSAASSTRSRRRSTASTAALRTRC